MAEIDNVLRNESNEEELKKRLDDLLLNSRKQPKSTGDLIAWLESVPYSSFRKTDALFHAYLNELIVRYEEAEDDELIRICFALHPDYPPDQFGSLPRMRCQYAIDHGEGKKPLDQMDENAIKSLDKKIRIHAKEPLQRLTDAILKAWQTSENHSLGLLKIAQEKAQGNAVQLTSPVTIIAEETASEYVPAEPLSPTKQEKVVFRDAEDQSKKQDKSKKSNTTTDKPILERNRVVLDFTDCYRVRPFLYDTLFKEELQEFDLLPQKVYARLQINGKGYFWISRSRPFYFYLNNGTSVRAFILYLQVAPATINRRKPVLLQPLLLFKYNFDEYKLAIGIKRIKHLLFNNKQVSIINGKGEFSDLSQENPIELNSEEWKRFICLVAAMYYGLPVEFRAYLELDGKKYLSLDKS